MRYTLACIGDHMNPNPNIHVLKQTLTYTLHANCMHMEKLMVTANTNARKTKRAQLSPRGTNTDQVRLSATKCRQLRLSQTE